jgi:hypothetical protein
MPNMPYPPGAPVYGLSPQQLPPRYAMPQSVPGPQSQPTVPPPPMLAAGNLKPKVRAQAPDAPPPAPPRIVLPSPEALGIQVAAAPTATAVDWNRIHGRLDQLGIVNLRRDRLAQGGYHVLLELPGRRVEGTGATEAAAMVAALERAESAAAPGR